MIQTLLDCQATLDQRDSSGATPLHFAALHAQAGTLGGKMSTWEPGIGFALGADMFSFFWPSQEGKGFHPAEWQCVLAMSWSLVTRFSPVMRCVPADPHGTQPFVEASDLPPFRAVLVLTLKFWTNLQVQVVKLLLDRGAEPSHVDYAGFSPWMVVGEAGGICFSHRNTGIVRVHCSQNDLGGSFTQPFGGASLRLLL